MRVLFFLFTLSCSLLSANLKIVRVVPFDTYNLKITFNQKILNKDFRIREIENNKTIIEVNAILLPYAKKTYHFPNHHQVIVAQNTKKIVRIVLVSNHKKSYHLSFSGEHLYLSFGVRAKLAENKQSNTTLLKKQSVKIQDSLSKKYRIVIDAGHGGKDCGATSVTKICEKIIVLDIARLLEKELRARSYQVFMTRNKDIYIDLKARTEMANNKNADLFISIHANSVAKTGNLNSQGIETYFLSTARSERARDAAEQENKGDVETMSYFSKLSFLNTLNSHRLIASNKLAIDVQVGILRELKKNYNDVIDGGVREGPFWVLAGALMPSVLIEVGYLSNKIEAGRLISKDYQQSLAVGIANGIDGFIAKNF